jgi:hypothetical protein
MVRHRSVRQRRSRKGTGVGQCAAHRDIANHWRQPIPLHLPAAHRATQERHLLIRGSPSGGLLGAAVAIAAQINHGGLGPINPALYKIGADSTHCANGFFDVTTGNNTADPSVIGYPATTGWDPVTGLGTPNAAVLLPASA